LFLKIENKKQQLNLQRVQWKKEHLEKERLKDIQRQEEKRRVILEKAQRDR